MEDRNRPDGRRSDRDFRGDTYYYGGQHSQRQDWGHHAWDNNPNDRSEGMYEAGGRDFDERLREAVPTRGERGWWASHSPLSGERPWYERRHAPGQGLAERARSFFGVGPKNYRRSDERIREDVCEALSRHPDVNASDIEVKVQDGQVILTGTVESRWMKREAENAVEFIAGVHDVHNELTIPRNTDASGELAGGNPPGRDERGPVRKAQ